MAHTPPTYESIAERFEILQKLEPGWQGDGRGVPYDLLWLQKVEAFVAKMAKEITVPFIYGTFNHDVELEWDCEPWGLNVTFVSGQEGRVEALSVDLRPNSTEDEIDLDVNLQDPDALSKLVEFVQLFESKSAACKKDQGL